MLSRLPEPPALRSLIAKGRAALFLDFDGTLVDIAATPDGIFVPDGLVRALEQLSRQLDNALAVVSGRSVSDLERHLGRLPFVVAGSHGSQLRDAAGAPIGDDPSPLASTVRDLVDDFAASHDGVSVERKTYGIALHYRGAPHAADAVEAFASQLAKANELQLKRGKSVREITQPGGGKDRAVARFMSAPPFAGCHPVFIGDDITDEDGFAQVIAAGGTAIRVGPGTDTAAQFALADPAAVRDWLGL